jgi:tetratricopeptide (TPR) repeat protein
MANFRLVQCLYYARQFDAAIQAARKANELPPEASYTHGYLALSLVAIGALDEAWSTAQEARRLGFGEPLVSEGHFGYVAGLTGHSGEAQGVIHELKNRRGQGYCPALPTALVHLGLGELGNCLCWLETALAEREPYLASAFVFPGYDLVKHEVRFKAILNAIGASTGDAVIASPFASSIRSARR